MEFLVYIKVYLFYNDIYLDQPDVLKDRLRILYFPVSVKPRGFPQSCIVGR